MKAVTFLAFLGLILGAIALASKYFSTGYAFLGYIGPEFAGIFIFIIACIIIAFAIDML